jgi:hypothetical protein
MPMPQMPAPINVNTGTGLQDYPLPSPPRAAKQFSPLLTLIEPPRPSEEPIPIHDLPPAVVSVGPEQDDDDEHDDLDEPITPPASHHQPVNVEEEEHVESRPPSRTASALSSDGDYFQFDPSDALGRLCSPEHIRADDVHFWKTCMEGMEWAFYDTQAPEVHKLLEQYCKSFGQ